MRIVKLDEKSMENILADMLKRDPNNYDSYTETVQAIVEDVKERGDEALFEYTRRFDGAELDADNVRVTEAEIREAMEQVEPGLLAVMKTSMENIRRYHEKQCRNSWFDAQPDGTILGQKVTALESVGVYVPGGKAAYPSSVLMNIVPAEVAGVKRIVSGGSHGGLQGGRRPGGGGPGLRHPVHSKGEQDRGPGKYFRGPGEKGRVRPCEHRQYRGAKRDSGDRG